MCPNIKRSKKGRKRLHTDEKILLHLSEFTLKREMWDAPFEVTQKGISERLDMLENNVSRAVKRLIKEKVVEKDLRHIKGAKRRKNAYFLTPEGNSIVQDIKESGKKLPVTIMTENGQQKVKAEVALRESVKRGKSLTLLDIYLAKEREEEPIQIFEGGMEPMEPKLVGRFQPPDRFFGREDELVVIDKFLGSPAGVLMIKGIAGVGKTTLILHALSGRTQRGIYIGCEPWTDAVELLNSLRQGASELGIEDPFMEIPSTNPSPGVLARATRESAGSGLVIVIDDIQKTKGAIDMYLDALCKASMGSKGLKTVMLTRETPDFIDPRYEIHGDVISMDLEGLDRDAIAEIMGSLGKRGDPNALWQVTRGHPLYLELALSSPGIDPKARFHEFLDMEAISPLSKNQLKALRLASASKVIVHRSLFYDIPGDDIDRLRSKGLLRETASGLYAVHDLISDHILQATPTAEIEEIRNDVLAYLLSSTLRIWGEGPDIMIRLRGDDSEDTLNLIGSMGEDYPSVEYEEMEEMNDLVKDYIDSAVQMMLGTGMIDEARLFLTILIDTSRRGRGRMLFSPVYTVDRILARNENGLDYKLRKSKLEIYEGEWERAEVTLESIEGRYPDGLLKGRRLAVFQHLRSMLSRYKGEYDEMLDAQRSAVATYEKLGDRLSAAMEKLHLSRTMLRMGDADGALKEAVSSANDYSSIPDRTGEIHASIQCFRSAKVLGKENAAEKYIQRAKKLSSRTGDQKLSALVQMELIVTGGRFENKDLELFDSMVRQLEIGDPGWVASAYLRIARAMEGVSEMEGVKKRGRCLNRANKLLDRRGTIDLLIDEEKVPAQPYQPRTARAELLEQTLSILDAIPQDTLTDEDLDDFGLTFIDGGDPKTEVLRQLSDLYSKEVKGLMMERGDSLDSLSIDRKMEGYVHSLIRLGNHLRQSGMKSRAIRTYSKCKEVISDFEERMSTVPEYNPSWDVGKVKEVLEHNRSRL